jgi:hypothetical protein
VSRRKAIAVTAMACANKPKAQADPIAPTTQMVAPVVAPVTSPRL